MQRTNEASTLTYAILNELSTRCSFVPLLSDIAQAARSDPYPQRASARLGVGQGWHSSGGVDTEAGVGGGSRCRCELNDPILFSRLLINEPPHMKRIWHFK